MYRPISSARKVMILRNHYKKAHRRLFGAIQPHSAMQTEFTHPRFFKKKVKKAQRRK